MVRGGFLAVEARAHLEALVRRASERHGIARRANAILLLDDGLSCEAVAKVLYLDDDTVRGWQVRFQADGVAALATFGWKGSRSKLSPSQEAELVETLSSRLFASTAAVMAHIEKRHGIVYSKPGTIKLLHRLGFDYRKPKGLPAKADAAAQEAFVAAYEGSAAQWAAARRGRLFQ
jgi:transposase